MQRTKAEAKKDEPEKDDLSILEQAKAILVETSSGAVSQTDRASSKRMLTR